MTTILPRVNYSRMTRADAERTRRDRTNKTVILRYAFGADDTTLNYEALFAQLDEVGDEEVIRYFAKRFQGRYSANAAPEPVNAIQNSRAASQKALRYCLDAQRRGERPDYRQALEKAREELAPAIAPQGQHRSRESCFEYANPRTSEFELVLLDASHRLSAGNSF